jgi:hypothetical protein
MILSHQNLNQKDSNDAIDVNFPPNNNPTLMALRWSINRVTPRTNELVKSGKVVVGSRRECRVTGPRCIAWKCASAPTGNKLLNKDTRQ